MKTPFVRFRAAVVAFSVLVAVMIIKPTATMSDRKYTADTDTLGSIVGNGSSALRFLENCSDWIPEGLSQYGESSANASLTAGTIVGKGERYENIQDAFNSGYSCIYLKKQRFNITQPIVPRKENFYVTSNGAEIYATEPMTCVFDIRALRYAHFDDLIINGNGLARKCIDAFRTPSQVPMHQIRNCRIWGATIANIDFTGCEDSLIFNCWIDGRIVNDTPEAITQYGVKLGELYDDSKTGGQVNLIHCLFSFHRQADLYMKCITELKLANCLLASKNEWSSGFEGHIIVDGGSENSLRSTLELSNCWIENGPGGNVPNILIRNHPMSKLTIMGGTFYADKIPNIYSSMNPCAETITIIGAFFEHNTQCNDYNVVAATGKLVSVGNTYNWQGIDKTNVSSYLIFDRDDSEIETNTALKR